MQLKCVDAPFAEVLVEAYDNIWADPNSEASMDHIMDTYSRLGATVNENLRAVGAAFVAMSNAIANPDVDSSDEYEDRSEDLISAFKASLDSQFSESEAELRADPANADFFESWDDVMQMISDMGEGHAAADAIFNGPEFRAALVRENIAFSEMAARHSLSPI